VQSQTFEAQKENEIVTVQAIQEELIFRYGILPPNRTINVLLGAKLRHFEVFFHGVTS
jgi:hypothetical protein